MSLQIWLPFTDGTLRQQGSKRVTVSSGGTVSLSNSGKLGKCATFTSTAGGLTIPPAAMTSFTTKCSVCFWLKINGWGSSYDTYFQAGTGSTPWAAYIFGFLRNGTNSTICFTIGNGSSASNNSYLSSTLSLNTWYHVALTYETGKVKIYLNGNLDHEYTTSIIPAFSSITKISIGRSNSDSSYQTQCNMNDLRIYDDCLSAAKIHNIAQGLVLQYLLNSKYIENTTNLITTSDCLSSTCYNGATSKYGYGTSTDIYKTTGTFQNRFCTKVYMGTAGNAARPYVYFSNLFVSDGTNQPEYKTLSFDYYGTIGEYVNFYKLGSGTAIGTYKVSNGQIQIGTFTNSGDIPVVKNKWNHIELVLHGTTSANAEWGYCILGAQHTSTTTNYWLFANGQIETKDHATGYAGPGGTRTNTVIKDISGFRNNGTINNTALITTDVIKNQNSYSLNGVDNPITLPNLSTLVPLGEFTACGWFKKFTDQWSSKAWETIFGGPSGFEFSSKSSSTNSPLLYAYSWNKGTYAYTLDAWHHWAMVRTASGTTFYLDGQAVISGTAGTIPSGNYFIGAWSSATGQNFKGLMQDFRIYASALSANDILSIYNNDAYIDTNGEIQGKIR